MKKQRIRNERTHITEPIYNIALYYCNRDYSFHKRNSKRALSSVIAITNYLHDVSKKQTKKNTKWGYYGYW